MITFLTLRTILSPTLSVSLFIMATYLLVYYLVYLRKTKRWEESNIPFLRPNFLIGLSFFSNAPKYSATFHIDKLYKENSEKDLFGFFLGTMPVILIKDRKLIRQVYTKSFKQVASILAEPESEIEAQYMVNCATDEEAWKFTRVKFAPVYSANWFQGPRFEGIKEGINELWRIAERAESEGAPLNLKETSLNVILNIGNSNLGIKSHSQTMKDDLRAIINNFADPSFRRIIIFICRSNFPLLRMFETFKIIPRKSCDTMSSILERLLKERDQMNIETNNLLDILKSARTELESKNSRRSQSHLPSIDDCMRRITGMAMSYVLAMGAESVHGLFILGIHSLSVYPEYQRKVRREVREALKKHGVSDFNYEVVRSLSFTFQCIFETSRLYPAGPLLMRQCMEDFQIPGTKYNLRKGDKVGVPFYSISRDENIFPDPDTFNPERFKSNDIASLLIPEDLLNFGFGPRKCPGYKHGMIVVAAMLAALVHKYEIKPHSHLKLIDATDYNPKGPNTFLREALKVDLVRLENLDDVF